MFGVLSVLICVTELILNHKGPIVLLPMNQSCQNNKKQKHQSSTSPFNLNARVVRELIFDHKHRIKVKINSIRPVGKWMNHKPIISLDREQGLLDKAMTVRGY